MLPAQRLDENSRYPYLAAVGRALVAPYRTFRRGVIARVVVSGKMRCPYARCFEVSWRMPSIGQPDEATAIDLLARALSLHKAEIQIGIPASEKPLTSSKTVVSCCGR